jgi:hypothetical protein
MISLAQSLVSWLGVFGVVSEIKAPLSAPASSPGA